MRLAPILAVLTFASGAHADERTAVVHVGGLGQLDFTDGSEDLPELDSYSGVRATVGWEPAALAYPAQRGYRVGGALVPELIGGALMRPDRAEALLGAGLRAELRIVQREGGWLRVNSRSALYLAARGMVVGQDRDVVLEGVFGDHFSLGSSPVRFGFEVGVTARHSDGMEDRAGALVQLYLGYAPR